MGKFAENVRELEAYTSSFELQQRIFQISKAWPSDEKFALTGQIRRSSRSIGANLSEAWAKRRYHAHFLSKLTDCDGELQETIHWMGTAAACGYLASNDQKDLESRLHLIGCLLGSMIQRYQSFCHFAS